VSISVMKCSWVKCSEVSQCSIGLRNMVSIIIRSHTDNMGLLLIYNLLLSHSFNCLMYFIVMSYCIRLCTYCIFMYLLYVYIFIVCLCIPSATLTEVFPCFFLSCKANARVTSVKMGHGPHSS
jgi:hypothetical protein